MGKFWASIYSLFLLHVEAKNIAPTLTQLSQTLNDNQMLGLGRLDCANPLVLRGPVKKRIMIGNHSDLSADDNHTSSLSARICYYGPEHESFCLTQGLPTEILVATWNTFCPSYY